MPGLPSINIVFFSWMGLPDKLPQYMKQPRVPLEDLEKEWKLEPEDFQKVKAMIKNHIERKCNAIRPVYAV